MKSSYELAMERLNKTAPAVKLSGAQKKALAELDSRYAAKTAEREIALNGEIAKAAGDFAKGESLRAQLAAAEAVLLYRQTRFAMCSFHSCPHRCGLYGELPRPPTWAELPAAQQEQRPAA